MITLGVCDLARARRFYEEGLGWRVVKPASRAEWGGYSGYFADPDGHLWEVAYNPGFPIDAEGNTRLG
nr:VOC family protein [Halomonas gemina]